MFNVDFSKESQLQTVMNDALRDFKINANCFRVKINEHLAFFDLNIIDGSSSSSDIGKIRRRSEEIQLRIMSKTIPSVKLIPEKGIIRLQVAMTEAKSRNLEDLYRNLTIPSDKEMMIPVTLGMTDEGKRLTLDIANNPHTLIAGATSSGKSVLIHNIIANIMYLNSYGMRDVDIYLVDPKQVEFAPYVEDVFKKHVVDVVSSYEETLQLMRNLESEMENRYAVLREEGYVKLSQCPRRFSQIVVIIDEVADLMLQDKGVKIFEKSVQRLAAKARAAGIHLIMATQRPSTDVITGLIKSNFPARIACKTAGPVDSRVIMDSTGAENLMGRGDALLKNMEMDNVRFQVSYSEPKTTARYLSMIAEKN